MCPHRHTPPSAPLLSGVPPFGATAALGIREMGNGLVPPHPAGIGLGTCKSHEGRGVTLGGVERVPIVSPGACQGTGEIPGEGGLCHFEMSPAKGDTWVVSLALWGHLTVPCRSSWDVTWHRGGCQLPQGCLEAGDSPSDTGVLGHLSQGGTFGDMVGAGVTTAMAMMLRRDVTWVSP